MTPNVDFLPFFSGPIPVGKNMQYGLRSPPCLVIEIIVFGKTACVHCAEMRADARPAIRAGLAPIIKSRPHEAAGKKITFSEEAPPFLGGGAVVRTIHIVSADVSLAGVIGIDPSGAISARRFGAQCRQCGKSTVKAIQIFSLVIEALNVYSPGYSFSIRIPAVHRHRNRTRWIERMSELSHRLDNALPSVLALHRPLFVTQRPNNHTGMIPVA